LWLFASEGAQDARLPAAPHFSPGPTKVNAKQALEKGVHNNWDAAKNGGVASGHKQRTTLRAKHVCV